MHPRCVLADEGSDGTDRANCEAAVVFSACVAYELASLDGLAKPSTKVRNLVRKRRQVGDYVITRIILERDRHFHEGAAFAAALLELGDVLG